MTEGSFGGSATFDGSSVWNSRLARGTGQGEECDGHSVFNNRSEFEYGA